MGKNFRDFTVVTLALGTAFGVGIMTGGVFVLKVFNESCKERSTRRTSYAYERR